MTAQQWVWVARPEYCLEDVEVRADLDPATHAGEQVRRDIAYLIAVRSDAERLDDTGNEFGGLHVCRYQILARVDRSLTIAEMRSDDVLSTWPALRAAFVKRSFPEPDNVWAHRLGLATEVCRRRCSAAISGSGRSADCRTGS